MLPVFTFFVVHWSRVIGEFWMSGPFQTSIMLDDFSDFSALVISKEQFYYAGHSKWWRDRTAAFVLYADLARLRSHNPDISCDVVWTFWLIKCSMFAIAARDSAEVRRVMGIRKGLFTK